MSLSLCSISAHYFSLWLHPHCMGLVWSRRSGILWMAVMNSLPPSNTGQRNMPIIFQAHLPTLTQLGFYFWQREGSGLHAQMNKGITENKRCFSKCLMSCLNRFQLFRCDHGNVKKENSHSSVLLRPMVWLWMPVSITDIYQTVLGHRY